VLSFSLDHLKKKKNKNIITSLSNKSHFIVQILKESTNKKSPSITGDICLSGRYLNLSPLKWNSFFNKHNENESTQYLKAIFYLLRFNRIDIKMKKIGVYVTLENVVQELYNLLYEWDFIYTKQKLFSPPLLIGQYKTFIYKILLKFYNSTINQLVLDSYT
jgi:Rne/Rng family ribonuclease